MYPATIPIINGISFVIFLPYTDARITVKRVTSAHTKQIIEWRFMVYDEPISTAPTASLIAFPARESPIIATVGPITTEGISLFIQPVPTHFTTIEITT